MIEYGRVEKKDMMRLARQTGHARRFQTETALILLFALPLVGREEWGSRG
jgi:hypothetical protein